MKTLIAGLGRSLIAAAGILTGTAMAFPVLARAQSAPPAIPDIRVPRVPDDAIRVDGIPDEEAWKRAAIVGLSNDWGDRKIPGRTLVRLLHSGKRLFVSFVCEDHDVVATHRVRDDMTFRDDCVEILLAAPMEAPHEGLNIEANAAGVWADVLFRRPNWLNYDWNPADLRVASSTEPRALVELAAHEGFSVEVALPFSDIGAVTDVHGYDIGWPREQRDFLTMKQQPDTPKRLRANFARWYRPENVMAIWSDPMRPAPYPLELNRYGWLTLE